MNTRVFLSPKLSAGLAMMVLASATAGHAATNAGPGTPGGKAGAAAPAKPAAKATADAPSEIWLAELPKSEFVAASTPKEGRNPFSLRAVQARETPKPQPQPPVQTTNAKVVPVVETYTFTLNGLTSPPRATAMINGRTFEAGEEGEVKMANGRKVMIKCVEVRSDSAVITVGGQRRELRLRAGV